MKTLLAAVWTPLERRVSRLACWWFGCQPIYEAEHLGSGAWDTWDTTYEDRIGDTRHARMVGRLHRLRWRLLDSWRARPCPACHERKCKPDCDGIPF
jgi:hypothetical protein